MKKEVKEQGVQPTRLRKWLLAPGSQEELPHSVDNPLHKKRASYMDLATRCEDGVGEMILRHSVTSSIMSWRFYGKVKCLCHKSRNLSMQKGSLSL